MSLEVYGDEGSAGIDGYVSEELHEEVCQERDKLKASLRNFVNGVQSGAIKSDHDETLASAMTDAVNLLKD